MTLEVCVQMHLGHLLDVLRQAQSDLTAIDKFVSKKHNIKSAAGHWPPTYIQLTLTKASTSPAYQHKFTRFSRFSWKRRRRNCISGKASSSQPPTQLSKGGTDTPLQVYQRWISISNAAVEMHPVWMLREKLTNTVEAKGYYKWGELAFVVLFILKSFLFSSHYS